VPDTNQTLDLAIFGNLDHPNRAPPKYGTFGFITPLYDQNSKV
jgi:hypothetical protein